MPRIGLYLALFAGVLVATAAVAIFVSGRAASDAVDRDPPPELADVAADPSAWVGRRLRLAGQVAERRGPLFLLGDERLPVYATPRDLDPIITRADALIARGTLERFEPAVFERRFDRSFAAVDDLAGRYVLVADRIRPWTPADGTPGGPGGPSGEPKPR